ncbi:TIGR02679 family protein [Streptomyces sp. H10-C2]|uniref:TIGR02679 family protein n=1 Tax=unclassified Streptomyces TaxID=2593676 RepID=UPI0024BB9C97|nr:MULTISPECIES: TIGR02679 family protein [unclassified Streptomyces]MDJ0345972.1 TIGR02679 family protein [Streptomyces sp. PH10-H1]MDJ0373861.1 TIGR02679 family protein [Streptomyces sp. H10-C2]
MSEAGSRGSDSRGSDLLHGEGWQRLLAAARRRLERTGGELDGSIGLTTPTEAERRVVIGITGQYRPETAKRLTVDLADLDEALHAAHGVGLLAALARLDGPLRDRPGERRIEAGWRDDARVALAESRHSAEPWYAAWAETLKADGTLTRLLRRGDAHLVRWAVAVLDRLPVPQGRPPLPLPVLAQWTTGDTKSLVPGSPLSSLVLRALALHTGTEPPRDRVGQRLLWERFGAVADDLASQVLVLNVRGAENHVVANWLGDAADFGIPFRLTLHQLTVDPFTPTAPEIFVCENPAVLRAAAAELGERSAPLVCTEGVPSAACRRLLDSAVRAGARLRVRADFDWAGLRIAGSVLDAPGSAPWRMFAADYRAALADSGTTPLVGGPAACPWDPDLAVLLAEHGRAVMEEHLLALLLADLADR